MRELVITKWPDRKLPTLGVMDGTSYTILARFISDEAVEEFMELARKGMKAAAREEDSQ